MDIEIEEKEEIDQLDELVDRMNFEPLVSSSSLDWIKDETLVFIVRTQNPLTNFPILGKKMEEYVQIATSICTQKFIEDEVKIFDALLRWRENYNNIAVFYDDTPLFQKSTFFEIMQYFASKKMNFLPLKRGFVIKSDYVENFSSLLSSPIDLFSKEDFLVVKDGESFNRAFKILSDRIRNFHISGGVIILGENTVFIDADVQIESGAFIYPNNVIKGESVVCAGAVLESGNVIDNSIICENAKVSGCHLKNCKITENKSVFGKSLTDEVL